MKHSQRAVALGLAGAGVLLIALSAFPTHSRAAILAPELSAPLFSADDGLPAAEIVSFDLPVGPNASAFALESPFPAAATPEVAAAFMAALGVGMMTSRSRRSSRCGWRAPWRAAAV